MFYAYVGGGIKTVLTDFKDVKDLQLKHPYSSFRKFHKQDKAWEWLDRRKDIGEARDVIRYGDTFQHCYVTMEYFIRGEEVYYNFRTPKVGQLFITTEDKNVAIENRKEVIKVKVSKVHLADTILGHLAAIYQGVKILGELIDIEIIVPDHSIFYAITMYNGKDTRIHRLQNLLKNRVANYSVTLEDF